MTDAAIWTPEVLLHAPGDDVTLRLFRDAVVEDPTARFLLNLRGEIVSCRIGTVHYVAHLGRLHLHHFATSAFGHDPEDGIGALGDPASAAVELRAITILQKAFRALQEAIRDGRVAAEGEAKWASPKEANPTLAEHAAAVAVVGLPRPDGWRALLGMSRVLHAAKAIQVAAWWLAAVGERVAIAGEPSRFADESHQLRAAVAARAPLTLQQEFAKEFRDTKRRTAWHADASGEGLPFPTRIEAFPSGRSRLTFESRVYAFTSGGRLLACRVDGWTYAVDRGAIFELGVRPEPGAAPVEFDFPLASVGEASAGATGRCLGYQANHRRVATLLAAARSDLNALGSALLLDCEVAAASATWHDGIDAAPSYHPRSRSAPVPLTDQQAITLARRWTLDTLERLAFDEICGAKEGVELLDAPLWPDAPEGTPTPTPTTAAATTEIEPADDRTPDADDAPVDPSAAALLARARARLRRAGDVAPRCMSEEEEDEDERLGGRWPFPRAAGMPPSAALRCEPGERSATFTVLGHLPGATLDAMRSDPVTLTLRPNGSQFQWSFRTVWFSRAGAIEFIAGGGEYVARNGRLKSVVCMGDPLVDPWRPDRPTPIEAARLPKSDDHKPLGTAYLVAAVREELESLLTSAELGWLRGSGVRTLDADAGRGSAGWAAPVSSVSSEELSRRVGDWVRAILQRLHVAVTPDWVRIVDD